MKISNLFRASAGSLMICFFAISYNGFALSGNDKDIKNTPTHTVSIADINKAAEMPRELRNGHTSGQEINTLSISGFNIAGTNPGKYNLAFNVEKPGTIFVRIVDNNGYDLFFETFDAGINYNKQIDLSSIPAGTYFFQATQKGKTFTKKLIFS